MNLKRIIGIAVVGCISLSSIAFGAGSGQASTVSIGYYDTYANGSVVPMYGGPVDVTGYVNPTYSINSCWYEFKKSSGVLIQEVEAAIGFNGTLYTVPSVATADYQLNLNPDGPNWNSVVANGKAQN